MKHKKKKHLPLGLVVFLDALMVGVILLTFAFFHHALPAFRSEQARLEALAAAATATTAAEPTVPETTIVTEPETVPTTVPDTRTEWQKKFADHFTDEVVITENSYTSPEVSVKIDTVVLGEGNSKITYYVADVYVASLDNFTAYTAYGDMEYYETQAVEEMVAESNALFAISGDFLTYQKGGFLLRNGETYVATSNRASICVLYPDGTMETLIGGTYEIDDVLARNPLQVWSFGPVLLDTEGKVRDKFEVSQTVSYPNPRSAVGYFEPGHYCFVVVDGRQKGHSAGIRIPELAKIFEDMGCTAAYNLDGGGSAVMLFNQKPFSRQSNGGDRKLGDILVITEAGYRAEEAAQ